MINKTQEYELLLEGYLALLRKNLVYLRKKANKQTLDEASEDIDISRDSLHKLESDADRSPNLRTVLKLSLYYNVPMGDLLYKDLELEEHKKLAGLAYVETSCEDCREVSRENGGSSVTNT